MTPVNKENAPTVASLPFRLGVQSALKTAALTYSQTVRNEPGLLAYWRVGETQNADVSRENSYVALGVVPHLNEGSLSDASVEFFFQVISDEPLDYEPCLISHQIAHGVQTRFAFHVTRDLNALRFLNGRTNTLIFPPDGPIEVGQWYHFWLRASRDRNFALISMASNAFWIWGLWRLVCCGKLGRYRLVRPAQAVRIGL